MDTSPENRFESQLGQLGQAGQLDSVPEDVYGSWSGAPSPDGSQVAFVSDRGGAPAVWIEGPEPGRLRALPTPGNRALRVMTVTWSPDGAWLACVIAGTGASRTEVWVVRPDGSDLHLVAGASPRSASIGYGPWHGWAADGRLLVTETEVLDSTCALLHPGTGERTVVATGPLLTLLDVDRAARRALLRGGPRGARYLLVTEPGPTGLHAVPTGAGEGTLDHGALSPDGETIYARSDVGRDLAALVSIRVGDLLAAPVTLAARVGAELEGFVPGADGDVALLLWNLNGGRSGLSRLDLLTGVDDDVPVLPRDVVNDCRLLPDGKSLLITAEDWSDPRGIWTVDLAGGQATPLSSKADGELRGSVGASARTVEIDDLTRPQLRRFGARDGLELTGWLYRPATPGPWPTMIHLHGGPEAQERPVYNSLFQSLVAAGVAVFAPNVRGSSGFGRVFGSADDREKRYDGIADVAACVDHIVSSGVSDPDRIGVMGRSYGGYLTLAALVWFPELFRVGVDVCGMADLETFYRHTEPRIAAAAVAKYGDPVRDAPLLRDLSPIHRIDALRAPLLIVHGAEDTNVPVEEAEQVAAALLARGVEHEFLLFEGEGHELLSTQNRVAFVRAGVAWVLRHLGLDAEAPAQLPQDAASGMT